MATIADTEQMRSAFEVLVRAVMVDSRVTLGNVEFWVDTDGPWEGQLSFSLPNNAWDKDALAKDLQAKLIESAWSKA